MAAILSWITGLILFLLSAIHVYWVLGGAHGITAAVPSQGGKPLFRPSKSATLLVALLLAIAAWLVLELGAVRPVLYPPGLLRIGGWLLGLVFIARAIGDFRWVGFFKAHKESVFARWDTVLFSPLCLFLGAATLALIILGR
ncbi:DUF3995 domain-containing protein [Paenibacillus sp. J22TS3]|uniref:DUF3995 domain-containing protein n=1 Tax=Paenibacillus sp. J22TS3 TaxID=2807192 RepID=UPI001B1918FE|nr:DUF3995 domain-containing protein [Paenibacillus sp. J22TS3]GIP24306.1 membrane protein [Paenibacillus sp. J22TS3]